MRKDGGQTFNFFRRICLLGVVGNSGSSHVNFDVIIELPSRASYCKVSVRLSRYQP